MDQENNNEVENTEVNNDTENTDVNNEAEKLYAGKYKSVNELEKGYKETTKYTRELNEEIKTLKDSIPQAPEEYNLDFKDVQGFENVNVSAEDPDIKPMLPVFKELNLSQDQVSRIIQEYVTTMQDLSESEDQIKENLGSEANTMLNDLQKFTNKLPVEDQQIMASLSDTSAGIDFLHRYLIGKDLKIPGVQNNSNEPTMTSSELFEQAGKFKDDNKNAIGFNTDLQNKYNKMMERAILLEEKENKK